MKTLLLCFFMAPMHMLAQINNNINARSVYSYVDFKSREVKKKGVILMKEFFSDGRLLLRIDYNFKGKISGFIRYEYDSLGCIEKLEYNQLGKLINSIKAEIVNNKTAYLMDIDILSFCKGNPKFTDCDFDKYGNITYAVRYSINNKKSIVEKYRIQYDYN